MTDEQTLFEQMMGKELGKIIKAILSAVKEKLTR